MASLLRLGSRTGVATSVRLQRSPADATTVSVAGAISGVRNASSDKAAEKKAKERALDKKMREKHGIISHEESLEDFTRHETLPLDTHTLTTWDAKDNMNARFVNAGKLVVKM